jgi:ribonuclease D
MSKIKLVEDSRQLERVVESLAAASWVGIDTEFLREKTYYPLLCLVQVHAESGSHCIDPLKVNDLTALERVLADPGIVKIIHSCRQDLEALDQRMDAMVVNLFDTQLAAGFCGYGEQVSYAGLAGEFTGVELDKSQTRTDWSRRPLSAQQLDYAMDDVNYLNRIRDALDSQLEQMGRVDWMKAECEEITRRKDYLVDPGCAWQRLKGGSRIPRDRQAAAVALATWRETRAQKSDRPREWILSSKALVDIASKRPGSIEALSSIDTVNAGVIRSSGRTILQILDTHRPDDSQAVWSKYAPLENEQKGRVKAAMALLRETAQREKISPALLANRSDIESLVSGDRDIRLLSGWRYDLIGRELSEQFA